MPAETKAGSTVHVDVSWIVNLIVAIIVVLVGICIICIAGLRIWNIIDDIVFGRGFRLTAAIVAIYLIGFGITLIVFTIFYPVVLSHYFGFYRYWLGRGLYFIFIACLLVDFDSANLADIKFWLVPLVCAVVLVVLGIILIVMHFFLPRQPRPFIGHPDDVDRFPELKV